MLCFCWQINDDDDDEEHETHFIDVIEIASFLRPVAMTNWDAVLTETSQIHNHDASLLPYHLHADTHIYTDSRL